MAHDTQQADQHPLHHAVMNCIEKAAARDRSERTKLASKQESVGIPQKRAADELSTGEDAESAAPTGGYLCTGLDMYITHEPCVM
jgi:tRNA-specific adenosine deaminase 3